MVQLAPSTPCRGTEILLVDDNGNGLAARKSVLEELGYTITAANSAQMALEELERQSFDLVITDYRMPRVNGLEFIRQLRERVPNIPVILISGFVDAMGLNESNTGANVVIQKSANEVQHLIRSVNRLLKRKTPKKPVASQTLPRKMNRKSV
ncbi:MAG: response regulator [Bryobacteraceae bacterium]